MSIKVLVNGAAGRMGTEACIAVQKAEQLTLVGTCEKNENLAEKIQQTAAHVVVDFTTAEVGFENVNTILNAGARAVVGTSGFLPEQIAALEKQCTSLNIGAIIAPNFSIAAVLMMQYAQDAARYYPQVEIIEMHHDGKLDSPSGTALKTAEMIAVNRKAAAEKPAEKAIIAGARGAEHQAINIHSVRLPGLVAHQAVIFGGLGESLTIKHDSLHRVSFMPGVVLACEKVMNLNHLVYGLEHIL